MQITNSEYQGFLLNIRKQIEEAQNSIIKTITRQKIVTAWNIGRSIDKHLLTNNKSEYGESLMIQLAQDINITAPVLYKMRKFYQSYPKLPQDSDQLNWSHYRTLSGVKKEVERKNLENLVIKNGWGSNKLEEEIKKIKSEESTATKANKTSAKLTPVRGQLFTYPLINNPALKDQKLIDLGFNVFREFETDINVGATLKILKNNETYSPQEIDVNNKKLNIYKANLERVVDGDTIRVVLDLGFGVYHREILRLKGINAPERKTNAGKKSTKALENILKNVPFLIIKTIKIDIYGRYVADIFFDENKNPNIPPQQVAHSGTYLNQLLLNKGLASFLDM